MKPENRTPSGTTAKGVTRDEGKRRLAALREELAPKESGSRKP